MQLYKTYHMYIDIVSNFVLYEIFLNDPIALWPFDLTGFTIGSLKASSTVTPESICLINTLPSIETYSIRTVIYSWKTWNIK